MTRRWVWMVLALPVHANDLTSERYRMVSPVAASVAARIASPMHQAQIAGGSGSPVGIAASPNTSVVAGPTSAELPADRVFRDGLEG